MAKSIEVRCPYCLHGFSTLPTSAGNRRLRCQRCNRQFSLAKALPSEVNASAAARRPPTVTAPLGGTFWVVAFSIAALMVMHSRTWTPSVRGPQFLAYYLMIFIALLVASGVLRRLVQDIDEIRWMACLTFEAIGVFRIIDGYSAGMRHFIGLIGLMLVGGAIFFARADHRSHRNNASGCSSGSSGCSTGSSGCGGGGGGCGGCGG